MEPLTFIDAHVHGFLTPTDETHFASTIHALTTKGLEKIIITVLPYHHFDYQTKRILSPSHIQPVLSKDNFDETALLIQWIDKYQLQHTVIPFLDVRFITEKVRDVIRSARAQGCRGIKGAFIPESDRVLNIQGIPQALGISPQHYRHLQGEIFSCAHEFTLPLLYHINLSQYAEWLNSTLEHTPTVRVTIPHFGYSLRGITDLLNRFEHTYTDPSFLLSLLRKNNQRYLNFITSYSTRILMGSDTIITTNPVEEIISYARYFAHLTAPEAMKHAILRNNTYRFLALTPPYILNPKHETA
jgi:hypothetical protein